MSHPRREPDAEVLFELKATALDGLVKRVRGGYRPLCDVHPDFWTSCHHEFIGSHEVCTGQSVRALVWFLSPEHYPHSLWVGRVLNVAEGSRVVGAATVLSVFNPVLRKGAQPEEGR